jgi:hypothetical protein
MKMVKLETNENCLITEIRLLEIKDSMIFVLDIRGPLYVFNMEGQFLMQVGKMGYGPDEYMVLNTFYLDDTGIVIIDDYKCALIKYDFKGQYVSSEKLPMEFIRRSGQAVKMDNTLLLYHGISGLHGDDNMAYSVINLKTNKLEGKQFSYAPIKLNNYAYYYSNHPTSKSEEGINLILPLCDTIYSYNGHSFIPKYIVETPSKMATKNQVTENTEDFTSDMIRLGQDGFFIGFWGIFETIDYMLLECRLHGLAGGYFLCDKRTRQGHYYYYSPHSDERVPFFRIKYACKDTFVGYARADQLLQFEWNIPGEDGQKFKDMVSSLREDDNPVLFFYKFTN